MSLKIPKKDLSLSESEKAVLREIKNKTFKPGSEHKLPSGQEYVVDQNGSWRRKCT